MPPFTVYPAIDLRGGKVVRLKEGDPVRLTRYSEDPAAVAKLWIDAGAQWLHVVNLDGAFRENDNENTTAITHILATAAAAGVQVQIGGGIQSAADMEQLLDLGAARVILGSAAVARPQLAAEAVRKWSADRILVSIDARDGIVRTRGWQDATALFAADFARHLAKLGITWLVYTDIARDGLLSGLNLPATQEVAQRSGLHVIASGGVAGWDDIYQAAAAGLAGVITGKALYEGRFDPVALFAYKGGQPC
ncbi:MAG: 1-(5-phosphoribosyl)-5-[(5-phosphoribosylamino)methylideneamino]imidazole-4-carboxamide isomerase [Anaerolineae bacterium]|nr:1-(5-phosphoribosyl)-5-[(5-phosphoribosylamino)methylideneamino]imidazole-4-carboxamide isomerase [Anaerolineae bacterium]